MIARHGADRDAQASDAVIPAESKARTDESASEYAAGARSMVTSSAAGRSRIASDISSRDAADSLIRPSASRTAPSPALGRGARRQCRRTSETVGRASAYQDVAAPLSPWLLER